jgi:hypothetical protein
MFRRRRPGKNIMPQPSHLGFNLHPNPALNRNCFRQIKIAIGQAGEASKLDAILIQVILLK